MDLYSGFCNICYKTYDGSLQDISAENMKNFKTSLITFVGHADIVNHNIINICQLCCMELTRSNKFREICFTNLIQLRQDKTSNLQDFCNICCKTDDSYLKATSEENMKNLKATLITFIGHADYINDKIINLCQSCCEELTRSNKFKEMCFTNVIQLRQSVIDMKSKLDLEDDTCAVQNKLQIFVHQKVLRRYALEKSKCPVSFTAEYELMKSSTVSNKNDSVFNRQIINLQSERNERQLVGECSDVSVINSAAEYDESRVTFKNEGFAFVKCEIESDEDLEYTKGEFDVKNKVELSNFECESSRHVNEGMINSGSEYKEEELNVKQENSSEDSRLGTSEDESGDGQNVPIEFVNVCADVKMEECDVKTIVIEVNAENVMNLPSTGCKNKLTDGRSNSQLSRPHVQEHRNRTCSTALQSREHKYVCTVCNKTFRARSWLSRHERIHSGDKPYKCTMCDKAFAQPSSLSMHKRTHNGDRPYKCTVCNKAFAQSSNLTVHERRHTGERPYKCAVCYKTFIDSSSLAVHKRIHDDDKPHICTVCNKEFIQLFDLTRHERTHSGEKPYKCSVCTKAFAQASNLTVHERRHTGERPYKCAVCNKEFTQSFDLTRHERTHGRDRQHECTACNKKFVDSLSLTKHKCKLGDDRPYKCTICNMAFKKLSTLSGHKRTHRDERPYQCTTCKKAFLYLSRLVVHERLHSGEKPYKCTKCNTAFITSSLLTRHERKH